MKVEDRPGLRSAGGLDERCGPVAESRSPGADPGRDDHFGHHRPEPGTELLHRSRALGPGPPDPCVVIRRTNPSDRRSSLLELTDDGRQLVAAAEATFTETLAELTADLLGGPSGLAAVQVLSELRSVLERDQIGLPTG
ncbi:hypothetical protein OHS81_05845 [Streptomyces sp. NBC_00400]|uniref:hypothetical protein n=1 Tax=Streptomyces sp. NBC_00400 TaxID=2975737 RepID=UPI0030DEA260